MSAGCAFSACLGLIPSSQWLSDIGRAGIIIPTVQRREPGAAMSGRLGCTISFLQKDPGFRSVSTLASLCGLCRSLDVMGIAGLGGVSEEKAGQVPMISLALQELRLEGLEPSLWLSSRAPPAAEHVGWKQTAGTWPILDSGLCSYQSAPCL